MGKRSTAHHVISRKQLGYIIGLERESGHQIQFPHSKAMKSWGKTVISDLLARIGKGDPDDVCDDLHTVTCCGCALDRIEY